MWDKILGEFREGEVLYLVVGAEPWEEKQGFLLGIFGIISGIDRFCCRSCSGVPGLKVSSWNSHFGRRNKVLGIIFEIITGIPAGAAQGYLGWR